MRGSGGRMIHKTRPDLCSCGVHSPVRETDISQIITQTNVYMLGEPVKGDLA